MFPVCEQGSQAGYEREGLVERDGQLDIEGVMGPPVFWGYRVSLAERDVLDFLDFLKQPVAVQYLIEAEKRSTLVAAALVGALLFLRRTLFLTLGGKPATPAAGEVTVMQQEREDNGERGS